MVAASDDVMESFYAGIVRAYQLILETRPDVIVIPLRGAEPLWKFIRSLANSDRCSSELPLACHLRLGEYHALDGEGVYQIAGGAGFEDKEKFVREGLSRVLGRLNNPQPTVCILDEAFNGGSIVKNYALVHDYLGREWPTAEDRLFCIAISDSRGDKTQKFKRMVESGGIVEVPVKALFTMDSPYYLYTLVKGDDDKGIVGGDRRLISRRFTGDREVRVDGLRFMENRLDVMDGLERYRKKGMIQ